MSASLMIAAFLVVGVVVGSVHAALLRRAVALFAGAGSTPATVALNFARFGFVIAAFWLVAQESGAALVAAVIGFTLAVIGASFFVERG
jgi:hypothetical protein